MKSRQNLAKMNRLEKLLELINSSPDGVSLLQASRLLKQSPRTLLRRLHQLMDEGKVRRQGKGPATRYVSELSDQRRRSKKSVGYNVRFLEKYIPNKTFFLKNSVREELLNLGKRSGDTAQIETFAAQIYERLLVDLSWSSSKLEGNTYSLLETERLLREQKEAQGKDQIETQMILNHKEAVSFVIRNRHGIEMNSVAIRNIHALLSDGLLVNSADGGKMREIPVGIEGSSYIPINTPQFLEEQFEFFIRKTKMIKDPFEQSFFSMVFIPYLQPFIDLNKRTSRIVCNIPFVKINYSPLSFNDTDREQYVRALIAIYEENDASDLSRLFVDAYINSAQRYQLTKSSLVPPNPLKIKYRNFIRDGVAQLIRTLRNQASWLDYNSVEKADRKGLEQIISNEIQGLHEGNFAKFDVRPSEFEKWAQKFRRQH